MRKGGAEWPSGNKRAVKGPTHFKVSARNPKELHVVINLAHF